MYLSNIKLWNFRKYGSDIEFSVDTPNLTLPLNKGLNVLIGENDSGKTAIIDAIKIVLKTHSYEWFRIETEDFYKNANRLRIELTLEDFIDEEAKNFTEWLSWNGEGENAKPFLRLIFDVKRNLATNQIFPTDVRAGIDNDGSLLNAEAKEYFKVTYLKPLRDAENELIPKRNSRLSKILQSHEAFKDKENHYLTNKFKDFNLTIEKYFEGKNPDDIDLADTKGKDLKDEIDKYLQSFYDKSKQVQLDVTEGDLKSILEKLELSIKDITSPGLGTLNRLFMAAELLHLRKNNWNGLRLGLIEELEAHLHPQAQMLIIESLQKDKDIQLLITTHSPNIGSKLKLSNLVLCYENNAFPMGSNFTQLSAPDYKFLEKFLDTTKANLFFAKGVILVEGWAEEILIPSLAKKINCNLTENGISIINVGSTAFLRYAKIFKRRGDERINMPVAIITDLDVKPDDENTIEDGITKKDKAIFDKTNRYDGQKVKTFVSDKWTLEYCLFQSMSLNEKFKEIVQQIHSHTDWENFETTLTRKLVDKSLNKTEIAYRLAIIIEDDMQQQIPSINIDPTDTSIEYLINAIKYASGN